MHFRICFQGSPLRQDLRRGIIMGNQSLVLQRLGRNASGTYYCIATNSEGSAYSNPIQLDIRCECTLGYSSLQDFRRLQFLSHNGTGKEVEATCSK